MTNSIKRIGPPLLAMFAGALVVLPAIWFGMPNNNDLANHYHFAIPFYEALRHGELYPGWLATPNFGYGDVVVRFYPPALYYLLAAGRAITGNWYAGSLLIVTFLSALGSLGAYLWARSYVPRNIAIWAGLFYALMPYHLAEFYQAAQLAEFAAGAALLFALALTKRVCDEGRWRDAAGLAVSYAALVLSHLPLAVFGSLALLVYGLMSVRKNHIRLTLVKLSSAVLLGLVASSFYWVTMVAEMKWIIADGANPDPLLDYRRNFIFSTLSPAISETLWWMGLLAIATVLMCIPALGLLRASKANRKRSLVAVAVLLVFSLLMSTAASKPVWAIIPYLRMTQHPFRWLAVMSAVAPILMAAAIPFWTEQLRSRWRPLALIMTGLVMIAVTFSFSQTVRGATFLSRPTFERILAPLREAPGIVQWLPVWASASGSNKASYEKCIPPTTSAKIEARGRAIRVTEWADLTRTFEVEAGAPADARVATFYYPHWTATANGHQLPTRPAPDGALLISLPSERVAINLDFREPARVTLGNVASIIGWTLILLVLILDVFATKRRDHESIATRRDATN